MVKGTLHGKDSINNITVPGAQWCKVPKQPQFITISQQSKSDKYDVMIPNLEPVDDYLELSEH